MGGEPYWYFVKYKPDLDAVLDELRQREFQAGRYNPAMPFLNFPIDLSVPGPGAQHDSIEEAFEEADADGTPANRAEHGFSGRRGARPLRLRAGVQKR